MVRLSLPLRTPLAWLVSSADVLKAVEVSSPICGPTQSAPSDVKTLLVRAKSDPTHNHDNDDICMMCELHQLGLERSADGQQTVWSSPSFFESRQADDEVQPDASVGEGSAEMNATESGVGAGT